MVQSAAKTVEQYLKELPVDRRAVIEAVRNVILKNLPKGYQETMQYGMITYVVPLELYPAGYGEDKKTPLPFLSLAAQKNYYALYLMAFYGNQEIETWFKDAYAKSGKKLDMGKGCLRFKKVEDLSLDVVGKLISKVSVKDFIVIYQKAREKK